MQLKQNYILSEDSSVNGWKFDREHYAQMTHLYAKLAVYCFVFSSVFWSLFLIESTENHFWIGGLSFLFSGILFIRLRYVAFRNYFKAPSRL